MEWAARNLALYRKTVYPALLPLMRTHRLPAADWTETRADLNGLVRFAERPNLVSARVPSRFERALLPLIRTPRLPAVDWTDNPADLNGLVRFAARRNLVSARVPLHFNCRLPSIRPRQTCCVSVYWSPVFGLAVGARIQFQITLCETFVGKNGSGTRSAGTSVFPCQYHSTYAIQGVFKMLLQTSRVIYSNPSRRKGLFKHRHLSGSERCLSFIERETKNTRTMWSFTDNWHNKFAVHVLAGAWRWPSTPIWRRC